ncbi:MAG: hypothetical protein HWD82_07145 [Flavobacteriaceae bacterium]|nr:hypothetical protein [Flavobacteriaceae bacterium]
MKFFRILFITSALIFNSCAEDLDFDQVNDYVLRPIYTSALTSFTLLPAQLFDSNGVQQNSITDITNFEVFTDDFVKDNIVKIDFYSEIKNDFDRAVTINIDFLDRNNNVVYSFTPIQVQSKELDFTYLEEIAIASNPTLSETFKIRVEAVLENTGTQMNPNSTEEFEFKSAITVYIEADF